MRWINTAKLSISWIAMLVCLVAIGCGDEDKAIPSGTVDEDAGGSLVAVSECGGFQLSAEIDTIGDDRSCIEYHYDIDSVLRITHRNAGFNCCPVIGGDVSVDGNVITISEWEDLSAGACHCLCLFDLEFEICDLAPGAYQIIIIEPYWQQDSEKLEFGIDLAGQPVGAFCVARDIYPWGVLE
jgi:hypothetical protein